MSARAATISEVLTAAARTDDELEQSSRMGWSHEQIMDWLCANLPTLLLASS